MINAPPKALPPVIPVIFVPGVLGSNLRIAAEFIPKVQEIFKKEGRTEEFKGESWLPPTVTDSSMKAARHAWEELRNRDSDAVKLAKRWESYGPKIRQALMSPVMTEVDPNGVIPENLGGLFSAPGENGPAVARRRGWGSVHWESYGRFLVAMEMSLNRGHSRLGLERMVEWVDFGRYQSLAEQHFPEAVLPTDADLKHAAPFLFPVFAFGYNFTRSNAESAVELLKAMEKWIGEYQQAGHDCKQAILVTHSMGGLVARAASKKDSKGLILGVVHGVMPAIGAPVLYRRVVAGWEAEKGRVFLPELRGILVPMAGRTSAETTPVVGNAQGILELLPSHLYANGWLQVGEGLRGGKMRTFFSLPEKGNPYDEIYKQKDVWWRLIDPDLLDPAHLHSKTKTGVNPALAWKAYLTRINLVEDFHKEYASETDYHAADRTYVFYGSRKNTFRSVRWWVQNNSDRLDWSDLRSCRGDAGDRRTYRNIVKVRGVSGQGPYSPNDYPTTILERAEIQGWDGDGDETVPLESGSAPGKRIANICQLHGFDHQYAFDNSIARAFTFLTICKLARHSDGKVRLQ